jgi:hypothetical protein
MTKKTILKSNMTKLCWKVTIVSMNSKYDNVDMKLMTTIMTMKTQTKTSTNHVKQAPMLAETKKNKNDKRPKNLLKVETML